MAKATKKTDKTKVTLMLDWREPFEICEMTPRCKLIYTGSIPAFEYSTCITTTTPNDVRHTFQYSNLAYIDACLSNEDAGIEEKRKWNVCLTNGSLFTILEIGK